MTSAVPNHSPAHLVEPLLEVSTCHGQAYTNPCNGENARRTRAHCSATHSAQQCACLRCHPVWQAADVPDFFGPPIVRSLHRQARLSLWQPTQKSLNRNQRFRIPYSRDDVAVFLPGCSSSHPKLSVVGKTVLFVGVLRDGSDPRGNHAEASQPATPSKARLTTRFPAATGGVRSAAPAPAPVDATTLRIYTR